MVFYHEPVMASECIKALNINENGIYLDGTTGGAGHSLLIAERLKKGRLLCVDRDLDAINYAKERLKGYGNISFINDNFRNLPSILSSNGVSAIDGILLDLGVSSNQIDRAERGFSYMKDAPLDMRMDINGGLSARDVINSYPEDKLKRIFQEYGEERFSGRIASRIVRERQIQPIETTLALSALIEAAIPRQARSKGSHPAKRVFQAVRIEVNGELEGLYDFVKTIPDYLNNRGRIAVITFHSIEDRAIKRAFQDLQNPCKCSYEFPVCICNKKSLGKVVYAKPVTPSADETASNSRSRSAKLRVFEKGDGSSY